MMVFFQTKHKAELSDYKILFTKHECIYNYNTSSRHCDNEVHNIGNIVNITLIIKTVQLFSLTPLFSSEVNVQIFLLRL